MADLRVICVKWGRKYGPEWVVKLRNMVARHLSVSHEFVCVTDDPVTDVKCLPLTCNLPGWWQKVGLFSGVFPGDNLYLDLDVVITEDIGLLPALLDQDRSKLWALDDFSYSLKSPKGGMSDDQIIRLGGQGTVNSSVMMWHGDAAKDVWDRFSVDQMDVLHGDQNWITKSLWPNINLIPDGIAGSYKYGNLRQEPRRPITVFHGDPKPSVLSEQWILDHWR